METVDRILKSLGYVPQTPWAWDNFIPLVKALVREHGFHTVMEVGGGRFPSLARADADALGIRYTSNDISERELALAPDWVDAACFDIAAEDEKAIAGHEERYDFIYSKMVLEHVRSYKHAWRNTARLLKPGGMALAFHPTLYALPFVANLAIPEQIGAPVLRLLSPDRHEGRGPKFPAYYSGCAVSQKIRDSIRDLGFSEVRQMPFFSHHYYNRVPIVRTVHKRFSEMAAALNMTALSSFCFTIVRK